MEILWNQFCDACVSIFTDTGVLQAVGSLIAIVLATCVKKVRVSIVKTCKDLTRRLTKGSDSFSGKESDKYELVSNELAVLRAFLDAARVSVYQFHNGDRFALSDPIFKVTCSHENVRRGLVPDSSRIKYVLVSTIMNFIGPLMGKTPKTPGVSAFDTGDDHVKMLRYEIREMDYDAFHYHMDSLGTRTVYASLLYSQDKKSPLGILVIQYIHADESESDALVRKNISHIRSKMCQIEFQLDEALI